MIIQAIVISVHKSYDACVSRSSDGMILGWNVAIRILRYYTQTRNRVIAKTCFHGCWLQLFATLFKFNTEQLSDVI